MNSRSLAAILMPCILAACGSETRDTTPAPEPISPQQATLNGVSSEALQCALTDPRIQIGAGRDAASLPTEPINGAPAQSGLAVSSCQGNNEFQMGSALVDITGPAGGSVMMGYESPTHVSLGIHTRQYARAFVIGSPCNQNRVVYVSSDLGMIFHSIRQGVLAKVRADPELIPFYGEQNIMLNATHTHAGPGGYAHFSAFNLFRLGHDAELYEFIIEGIYQAIKKAHANLEANPEPGSLFRNAGELLNANINRSDIAYAQNPESERARYLNTRGEDQNVNKRMTLLRLNRADGSSIGQINWFGVHPTTTGNTNPLISSDNKGWASLRFEHLFGTDYHAEDGQDTFVAAFAQTDEGDSSPNIFFKETEFAERGGSADEFESVVINGSKQFAKALELFAAANQQLSGGVHFAQFHVQMDQVEVTDPEILASLNHPAELDAPVKKTCTAAMGVSFGAGAEDGPGPTKEGSSCTNRLDPGRLQRDLAALAEGKLPPEVLSAAVLCNLQDLPFDPLPIEADLSCHAEKPVLFVLGPPLNFSNNVLPFQIFIVGDLAIVGLPWEITTMAGRRIRETAAKVLAPHGVKEVVISGLSNDFVNYLTTREEYSIQQYEGASVQFGPWTLAAVQQEVKRLSESLVAFLPPPEGPPRTVTGEPIPRPPYVAGDFAGTAEFGQVLAQPPTNVTAGQRVKVLFQSAHPRNVTERGLSLAEVEQLQSDGSWKAVITDRLPQLLMRWLPADAALYSTPVPLPGGNSQAEIEWLIPENTASGTYRIVHRGVAAQPGSAQAFESRSDSFTVAGGVSNCDHAGY